MYADGAFSATNESAGAALPQAAALTSALLEPPCPRPGRRSAACWHTAPGKAVSAISYWQYDPCRLQRHCGIHALSQGCPASSFFSSCRKLADRFTALARRSAQLSNRKLFPQDQGPDGRKAQKVCRSIHGNIRTLKQPNAAWKSTI